MKYLKKIGAFCSTHSISVMIVLSMLLWIFSFRHFITGRLALTKDAISYYDHIKFYIDNIGQGVYPRWDPFWQHGIPNTFFLRRMGEFNPIFFIILILNKIGFPYTISYLMFLVSYYFLGMIGFFLLAQRIFRDVNMALVAFLLLSFSSFSTQLFYNYIILIFVPIIWFFYFLMAFTEKQERYLFVGLIFTSMLIVTTYIPFYFLTIFLSFLVCLFIFYFRNLKEIFKKYFVFFRNNKLLVFLCLGALVFSLVPGVLFFQETSQGEWILPVRNIDSPIKNILGVSASRAREGGVLAHGYFEKIFSNLRNLESGEFYIPIFVYILILIGVVVLLNKKLIMLGVLGFWIFLIGFTSVGPVHRFLYKYVFYFKLIRNVYYFLWIAVLPIAILFLVEQFRLFLEKFPTSKKEKYQKLAFIFVVHSVLAVFLFTQENIIASSYVAIGLSLLFFALYFCKYLTSKRLGFLFLLLAIIVIQPIEAYHYLSKNSEKFELPYQYDTISSSFLFERPYELSKELRTPNTAVYICTRWFYFFMNQIPYEIFLDYVRYKLRVYDYVEPIDDYNIDVDKVSDVFLNNRNIAFISSDRREHFKQKKPRVAYPLKAQVIYENSKSFQVIKFNPNVFKFKTNFDTQKFLVYNDGFHSQWQAFVNGKEVEVVRANIAFKGIWLPAGENIVYFRFGKLWHYFVAFACMAVFNAVFIFLVVLWARFLYKQSSITKNAVL